MTPRVLLIEDNEALVKIVCFKLEKEYGAYVDVANDHMKAYELLRLWPYNVVLVDLEMGGISGADLLRLTRNMKINSKFYVFSHHEDEYIQNQIYGIEHLFEGIIRKENMDEEFKKVFKGESDDPKES